MPSLTIADLATRDRPVAEKKKKKWIQKGASKHPGLFAEKAKRAGETTREYAAQEKHAGGKLGKEANFALNAMGAAKKKKSNLYAKSRAKMEG
jgi:hypothetical protein